MNAKPVVIAALVAAVGAGAVVAGDIALPGTDDAETEQFPTAAATPQPDGGDAGDAGGSEQSTAGTSDAAVEETPPFEFVVNDVEQCGRTCRDVNSSLTNQQDVTAENVTVYTRIFAGQGTDGDEIWRGDADVGTLDPGETYTTTRRVDLSLTDALKVQNSGGWITVQTTVDTDNQTVTYAEQRKVA